MRDHHKRAIDKLVERYGGQPEFPALIIVGSLARGMESENSDVDVVLVATREEFARRRSGHEIGWSATDICDYPGGYVDGKLVDHDFLVAAAERGSEPTRSWFEGAIVAYSRIPDLADLLANLAQIVPCRSHDSAELLPSQQSQTGNDGKRVIDVVQDDDDRAVFPAV